MPEKAHNTHRNSRIFLVAGVCLMVVLVATMVLRARRPTPALSLAAIPYSDGESWQYRWSNAGQQVGTMTMSISAGTVDARPVWTFVSELRMGIDPGAKPSDATQVTADGVTLLPLTTAAALDLSDGHYDINIKYEPRQASFSAQTPRGPQSGVQELPGATYDNDQMLMLIRALPLSQGYSTKLVCLQPRNIVAYRLTVKVEGQEELVVGSDKVACWRVSLAVTSGTQTAWYAVSPDHRLVRLDGPSGLFELQPSAATAGGPFMLIQ